MKIKAIIHTAEEGGYWAEVPILQGCYTQGETIEEVLENLQEVISLYAEDEPENLNPYLKNYSIVSKV
ncbi:type II toxin-antitoxin system HicB family antitoxin [Geminocystis herdmanii]|uniref:type II toxin-antitoxin system HicB family antitoxin n=1 Tax=Geminocystis herdmanii TaxID=669359 RepID=UPI000375548F|nr:type II toxin-antitoxin system HicB family antitoxin [Geminocystis herdmanii]